MGRHVSADRRRGIAAWPIIVLVVVLLAAAATAVYLVAVNRRSTVADCTSSVVLPVVAAPGAYRATVAAAAAFDATKPVARSACITTSVQQLNGAITATSLLHGWNDPAGKTLPAPALWVVDSMADVDTVDASNPSITAGHSTTPLATSPVVIAVPRAAATTAVSWQDLPSAASGLKLTMPPPAANRATLAAAESVVAGLEPPSAGRAIDQAAVKRSSTALHGLVAADPGRAPATTSAALDLLANGRAGFGAVPAMESDVARYGAAGGTALKAVYPGGPVAQDEILAVPVTATWVTPTLAQAAAALDAFLGAEEGRKALADNGLRVPKTSVAAGATGVDLTAQVVPLAAGGPQVRAALVAELTG